MAAEEPRAQETPISANPLETILRRLPPETVAAYFRGVYGTRTQTSAEAAASLGKRNVKSVKDDAREGRLPVYYLNKDLRVFEHGLAAVLFKKGGLDRVTDALSAPATGGGAGRAALMAELRCKSQFTTGDVDRLLRVAGRTVADWCDAGTLPSTRPAKGRPRMIEKKNLFEFLSSRPGMEAFIAELEGTDFQPVRFGSRMVALAEDGEAAALERSLVVTGGCISVERARTAAEVRDALAGQTDVMDIVGLLTEQGCSLGDVDALRFADEVTGGRRLPAGRRVLVAVNEWTLASSFPSLPHGVETVSVAGTAPEDVARAVRNALFPALSGSSSPGQ